MKKLSAIFRSLLISIASSFLIGFLPLSPLFAILSGSLGAFFYHTFSILPQEKQTKVSQNTKEKELSSTLTNKLQESHFILFSSISSIVNGLLIGYIFTLFFYLNLGKPPEDSWLEFEFVENLLRNTPGFRIKFFFLSAFIAGFMNYLGTFIIFRFGIGLSKPADTELLDKLKDSDFNKYLEDDT